MNTSFKKRLKQGEQLYGIMLSEIYVPNIARLLAKSGYDFLLVDCEHGYFDLTEVANIIAVAEGCNLPVVVRVQQPNRILVTKYLDMGATGILLSDVGSAQEAKKLVEICYYAPKGDRGISTFRAHTGYQNGNLPEIMRLANEKVTVICQIESPNAVEEVKEILSIDGVDGVLIGPNDLTQHMNCVGQYTHPDVQTAMRHVAHQAELANKWSGVITSNMGLLKSCAAMGMRCFSVGSELSALYSAASKQLAQAKEFTGKDVEQCGKQTISTD